MIKISSYYEKEWKFDKEFRTIDRTIYLLLRLRPYQLQDIIKIYQDEFQENFPKKMKSLLHLFKKYQFEKFLQNDIFYACGLMLKTQNDILLNSDIILEQNEALKATKVIKNSLYKAFSEATNKKKLFDHNFVNNIEQSFLYFSKMESEYQKMIKSRHETETWDFGQKIKINKKNKIVYPSKNIRIARYLLDKISVTSVCIKRYSRSIKDPKTNCLIKKNIKEGSKILIEICEILNIKLSKDINSKILVRKL